MCSWSAWSLVTVSVSFSPTARSTVDGAGVTLLPVTVMPIVRPAGLLDDDEDDDAEDVDELEEVADVDDEVLVAASSDPPQAARDRASASPAPYEIGRRSVIFVTNPSLNSAI
jgi:hypothetical protein